MSLAATAETPVLRRLTILLVGLALVAAGVAFTIRAEVGVAPYDVLTTGLADASGVDVAWAAMALPLLFTLLGWFLGRRPGPGTLLAVLLVGPMLGVVLAAVAEQSALAPRIALFVVGFVLIALGVTAVIVAEIGPGPAEIVMLAIHDKGVALAPARTGIELGCVGAGWILGGQVGAGTVVVALTIGPVLRFLLTRAGYQPQVAEATADCAAPGA